MTNEPWTKFNVELFGLVGGVTSSDSADSVKAAMVTFDVTGPHPRSRRGSVYTVTCIDPFSKWAEAFPVPNKEAPTIARVLVEQIM